MQGKRGLSAVVTTLIIILLVLVAVGGIWVVVNNFIQTGSEQIELGKFTLDLQIKSVNVLGDDVTVTVVVRRTGKGELIGMNFIFSDGQNSEVIRRDTILEELDVETFVFTLAEISTSNLKDVSVAPIYELSSGKEEPGNVADMFDIKKGVGITGGVVEELSNFEKYGPVGIGRMEYGISSGEDKLPEFIKIIVDPLDVHVGDTQTFIAYVTSPYEIIEVTTITQLDNEVLELDLEKTENEDEYMANWTVYDTHTTEYHTTFIAKDSFGNENNITLTWTDPCTDIDDHGTTFTLNINCQVSSGTDGVDVGNIVIASGKTLTMTGGTFIKTPGYTMTNYGTVAFGSGVLQTGYLYYNDADGDLYGSGYDWSSSPTYAGHTRANSALGGSDCLDSDADVYRNVGNMILDGDQDRYSTGSGATRCVGAKSSYWYKDADATYKWISTSDDLGTSDCNDGNNAVQVDKYYDGDNDGHCTSGTPTYCVAAGAGYPYFDSCTGGYADCNDNQFYVWLQATGTNIDSDRDGYEVGNPGSGVSRCIGDMTTISGRRYYNSMDNTYDFQVWSDRVGSNDCLDTASSVNPGVTAWFTTAGPNNWDYNCVSGAQKRYNNVGGFCADFCWNDEPPCDDPGGMGDTGYTGGSSPACGASGTYVYDSGDCYEEDQFTCADGFCDSSSRTQACH